MLANALAILLEHKKLVESLSDGHGWGILHEQTEETDNYLC